LSVATSVDYSSGREHLSQRSSNPPSAFIAQTCFKDRRSRLVRVQRCNSILDGLLAGNRSKPCQAPWYTSDEPRLQSPLIKSRISIKIRHV